MSERLSSDFLKDHFKGKLGLKVLYAEGNQRISQTLAQETGQVLELSYVVFDQAGIRKFPDVHAIVLSGVSMGEAFQAMGIPFYPKRDPSQDIFTHDLPPGFRRRFGEELEGPGTVIDAVVTVGAHLTPYARILETYSPAVPWGPYQNRLSNEQLGRLDLFDRLLTSLKTSAH
jgi:hypothetical protein